MYDLFRSTTQHPNAQRMPYAFEYVRASYIKDLINIQEYYQSRVYAVKNQHILVRLLGQIDVPMHYDVHRFVEVTRARVPYLAKLFRFTSEIDKGSTHPGHFMGPGGPEIIIHLDEYFDPIYAQKNWRRISAVNTLWHSRSDLGFMIPNGKPASSDTGITIITINLALLAFQYRCFIQEQYLKNYNQGEGGLGRSHFVHMYVLPNMLFQHTDIVIMNRLMNILYDKPMGQALFKHPFYIHQYQDKVDDVLTTLTNDYYGRKMHYSHLLCALPAIDDVDMEKALQMPDIGATRQVWWAMMLSRIKVMKYLIDLGGTDSIATNKDHINRLKIDLKQLKRDNGFTAVLHGSYLTELMQTIDEIMDI